MKNHSTLPFWMKMQLSTRGSKEIKALLASSLWICMCPVENCCFIALVLCYHSLVCYSTFSSTGLAIFSLQGDFSPAGIFLFQEIHIWKIILLPLSGSLTGTEIDILIHYHRISASSFSFFLCFSQSSYFHCLALQRDSALNRENSHMRTK